MSTPWPPPPDRASIDELVATADVEGFIADGAPADEYESESEQMFAAIRQFPTADLVAEKLLPILDGIWRQSFSLDDAGLAERRGALTGLAGQIARFFGPEAQPTVRSTMSTL